MNEKNSLLQSDEKDDNVKKLLLVDDDPVYAKMVRGLIQDQYKVNIVTAGTQAMKFLGKNKVDLVLLDYEMPETDGPMVLEMIRSDAELADVPVIFLTGTNSPEIIERLTSLNPLGYILKNTTKEELLRALHDFFSK